MLYFIGNYNKNMVNNDFHEEDGDNYLDDFNDGNGTDIYLFT